MENYLVQMAEVDDFLFTEQAINDYVSLGGLHLIWTCNILFSVK